MQEQGRRGIQIYNSAFVEQLHATAMRVSGAEQKVAMLRVAAEGQRELCRGQGAELVWARHPAPLTSIEVIDIFRKKTAPAFGVALQLGAIYAGQFEENEEVLNAYSEALGIAYQIRDDLSDLGASGETNDIAGLRPSLLLAIAYERAKLEANGADKALAETRGHQKLALEAHWRRLSTATPAEIEALFLELHADERCRTLLESYKEEAIRTLRDVDSPNLKGLLRRVIGKIFNDTEIKGWCKEFEQKNLGSPAAEPVAATA